MQDQRNGGVPTRPPDRDNLDYRAQRIVLLELVVGPPDDWDRLDDLIDRLELPAYSIEPAIAALELVGLAERQGDVVRAKRGRELLRVPLAGTPVTRTARPAVQASVGAARERGRRTEG